MITLTAEQAQQIEEIVEHLLVDHPTARHHKACVEAMSIIRAARAQEQEPVARVTGYHGGRCVVEPLNRALVLPTDMALYAEPMQQVTRADLKAAFKEGFERATDLYAPNDGQEPYAYEVWDVQDQSFTMIYATQLKEFHWIEPENIARVLYTAPVRTKDLTDGDYDALLKECRIFKHQAQAVERLIKAKSRKQIDLTDAEIKDIANEHGEFHNQFARAVIAADREKNK